MVAVKRLVKIAGIYTSFSILNRSAPFLLLPILTTYLSPSDYGVITYFTSISLFLMPIVGLNANTIVLQKYFKLTTQERQELLATTYVIMTIVFGIFILLWIGLRGHVEVLIKLDQIWFLIAIITAYSGMVVTMTTTLCQIKQESFKYGLIQLGQMAINVSLTLMMVVVLKYGWEGRLSAMVIASLLMMAVSFYINYNQEEFTLNMLLKPRNISDTAKSGIILTLPSIAGGITSLADRILLAPMVSMEALGIYSVAVMFCQILDIIFNALCMTYAPIFMKKINAVDKRDRDKAIWSSYALVAFFFLVASVFAIVASYVVNFMVNKEFHSATKFIPLLAFASAASAASGIFLNNILAHERNALLSVFAIFNLATTALLTYFLIDRNGAMGAAQAMLLASLISMFVNLIASVKINKQEN